MLVIAALFVQFYLTKLNSASTRMQNVYLPKKCILLLRSCLLGITVPTGLSRLSHQLIALDEMHSSAVLNLLVFFFVTSQLELVRVWTGTTVGTGTDGTPAGGVWLSDRTSVLFSLENQVCGGVS